MLRPLLNVVALSALCVASLTPAWAGGDHPAAPAPTATQASEGATGVETVEYNPDDPEIQQAVAQARASLGKFFKATSTSNALATNVAVKVEVREGKLREFIWVTPFHPVDKDQRFMGTVNDVPHKVRKVATGDNITFTRDDIVDWAYTDLHERRLKGNYTTCVMLRRGSAAERELLKNSYGLDCDKP
ncbi:MAG: hypothetical protein RI907_1950 [Pseudomonadota bacterium]|jgi:uncharacterized protein YegJ (DUF2314 family)